MDFPIQLCDQLGQHLRSFRQHRKMTQQQLAQMLGLSQSRIADIEADPGRVSVENLFKILTALNVQMVLQDRLNPIEFGISEITTMPLEETADKSSHTSKLERLNAMKRKPPGDGW
jgi:HTH-type transcriptional regulator / antitoxin HipB